MTKNPQEPPKGAKEKKMSIKSIGWKEIPILLDCAAKAQQNVYLWSEMPGTGKSWIARHGAENIHVINLTEETAAYELRGYDRLVDGEQKYALGPGYLAWTTGGRLVLEEVEKTSGDAMSCLLGLLDSPAVARARLPDGSEIRPADGYHVIGTGNASPEELPGALRDRFPITIEILEPNPKALELLPEEMRKHAKSTVTITDPARRIGLRRWLAYSAIRENGCAPEIAAMAIFGPSWKDVLNAIQVNTATK